MKVAVAWICIVFLSFGVSAMEKSNAALTIKTVYHPERDRYIEIYYWYPTQEINSDYIFGNSKVFVGVKTKLDATITAGRFPVILLAHGGLRSSFTQSGWVASSLAAKGFIVALPKTPDFDDINANVIANELSLRPTDLLLSLSNLKVLPDFSNSVDHQHVFGVGFFLGGTSMLSLAGAQINVPEYKQSCNSKGINIDCDWFNKNDIDLNNTSVPFAFKNGLDNRLKSIVTFSPELTKTLDIESLKQVSIPVTVVDLVNKKKHPLQPAKSLNSIAQLTLQKLSSTSVYSAFSECTEIGKEILLSEGEGDICEENQQYSRQQNHQRIIEVILKSFTSL